MAQIERRKVLEEILKEAGLMAKSKTAKPRKTAEKKPAEKKPTGAKTAKPKASKTASDLQAIKAKRAARNKKSE